MRYAYMSTATEIMRAAADFDGILSIGTGSVNDVCRYAAAHANKAFAIFRYGSVYGWLCFGLSASD